MKNRLGLAVTMMVMLSVLNSAGWAQTITPLQISTQGVIIDEFGEKIRGNASMPDEERPLVQILTFYGHMSPLDPMTGTPLNPALHPIVGEGRIGDLMVTPEDGRPGRFALAIGLATRPANGTMLFARVYNGPSVESSTYYADSEVMTIAANDILRASFPGAVTNLLAPARSTMNDGLTDQSREDLFGSASMDIFADLDGDGMTVWDEFIAGTDWTDPLSVFQITQIHVLGEESLPSGHVSSADEVVSVDIVSWASVAGRVYTLEYTTNLITGNYVPIDDAIGLEATPPINVFTNIMSPHMGAVYYRATVDWPDRPDGF